MKDALLESIAHWSHDGRVVRLSQGPVDVDIGALEREVKDECGVELVGQVVAHLVGHEHAVEDDIEFCILTQKFDNFRVFKHILEKFIIFAKIFYCYLLYLYWLE